MTSHPYGAVTVTVVYLQNDGQTWLSGLQFRWSQDPDCKQPLGEEQAHILTPEQSLAVAIAWRLVECIKFTSCIECTRELWQEILHRIESDDLEKMRGWGSDAHFREKTPFKKPMFVTFSSGRIALNLNQHLTTRICDSQVATINNLVALPSAYYISLQKFQYSLYSFWRFK